MPEWHGDVRLTAHASGESTIYQAGRDVRVERHEHFEDGVARARRASPGAVEVCPYPTDMAPFRPEQAEWFFGRDRLVLQIVDRLDERFRGSGGPLAVVAPSGAGKSSVLQAGLIPRLASGTLPGSRRWPVLLLTPTARPIMALSNGLAAVIRGSPAVVAEQLARAPAGFVAQLREALGERYADDQNAERLVLIIDQLEELFTMCDDKRERQHFLDVVTRLTEVGTDGAAPVALVVYGLRADFYAYCADHPQLRTALESGQIVVGPMSSVELREAILHPARRAGLRIEPGLVDLLLRDLGVTHPDVTGSEYEAGRLPLLAHALRAAWRHRHGDTLTVDGYLATGGIQDAVATTAERVFSDLAPAAQDIARRLFLRLINIGDGADDTRQRMSRAELLDGNEDQSVVSLVLNAFTQARLLTQQRDTVEITHEALLSAWPRLRAWIKEDHAGHVVYQQLANAARLWRDDPSAVYTGVRLEAARQWAADPAHAADLRPWERDFLSVSLASADDEVRRARRQRRRLRAAVVIFAVLALVAAVSGIAAMRQGNIAAEQRQDAISQRVAAQSVALRAKNPALSLLAAAASWRIAPTREARTSVLEAQVDQFAGELIGHEDFLSDVAIDRDGHFLASSSRDTTVRLWDLRRRIAVGDPLTGHSKEVTAVAFDPADPNLLATASYDGSVLWWDVTQHRTIAKFTQDDDAIMRVIFSPNGRLMALSTIKGKVRLWDVERRIPIGDPLYGHTDSVGALAFSSDSRLLATGSNDSTIRLWNVERRQSITTLNGHTHFVNRVLFTDHDRKLISASHDSTGIIWDLPSGRTTVLAGHFDAVVGLAISPDEAIAVTTGYDGTIRLWSIATGHTLRTLRGHVGLVTGAVFSPDGRILITTGTDHKVILWDLRTSVLLHSDYVIAVSLNGDGRIMATGGREQVIRLWDLPRRQQLGQLDSSTHLAVTSLAFNPSGTILASAGIRGTVLIWDAPRREIIAELGQPSSWGSITEVAFSHDGRLLATGGYDGTARIWDAASWRVVRALKADSARVTAMAFSVDNRSLVTSGENGVTRVWDVSTGNELGNPLRGHQGAVFGVATSSDGHTVATAGNDGTIRLWDLNSHDELATLRGHTGATERVTFTLDGKTLVSTSGDSTIRLWDVPSRTPLAVFGAHTRETRSAAISGDGQIVTVSADQTAMVWDINPDKALKHICASVGRDVTSEEWSQLAPELPFHTVCDA